MHLNQLEILQVYINKALIMIILESSMIYIYT